MLVVVCVGRFTCACGCVWGGSGVLVGVCGVVHVCLWLCVCGAVHVCLLCVRDGVFVYVKE